LSDDEVWGVNVMGMSTSFGGVGKERWRYGRWGGEVFDAFLGGTNVRMV